MISPELLLAVLALVAVCAAGLVVLTDRASRAEAWRRIAEERRWNAEQQDRTPAQRDRR